MLFFRIRFNKQFEMKKKREMTHGLHMGQMADRVRRPLSFYQAGNPDSLPNFTLKYTRRDKNRWPAAFRVEVFSCQLFFCY